MCGRHRVVQQRLGLVVLRFSGDRLRPGLPGEGQAKGEGEKAAAHQRATESTELEEYSKSAAPKKLLFKIVVQNISHELFSLITDFSAL